MFLKFCQERIATVSEAAATAFAAIIHKYAADPVKQRQLIEKVKKEYREGTYKKRQLFLIMSQSILNRSDMKSIFIEHFKEDTLSLAYDKVPNVRISLARVLRSHFKTIDGCFKEDKKVKEILQQLSQDEEDDVKNIIAQIKFAMSNPGEDSSSEVTSQRSEQMQTTADDLREPHYVSEDQEEPFEQRVAKRHDLNYSDLELSSQSATSVTEEEPE